MTRPFACVAVFAFGLALTVGCPDPSPEPDAATGNASELVTIPRSELHFLDDTALGDGIRVSVALPGSYAESDRAYPVVYALDANAWGWFGTYTEIARVAAAVENVPEAIVVGVGYSGSASEVLALRARDLTPVRLEDHDARIREQAPALPETVVTGGAPTFLRFLEEELAPFVSARYRVDPNRRVLFGHSLGGLFGLHVLFHRPEAFTDYIIGSPSLWYGERVTFEAEAEYAAAHDDLPARVFLSSGSLEERADVARSVELAMVSNMLELAARLDARGYPSLELQAIVFEGETHNGVVPASFNRGLRFALRPSENE